MKYIVCVGDGMADYPLEDLNGKTPLQVAKTKYMDMIAGEGAGGLTKNIPRGMHPGSDVAALSILGYDPKKSYTGRAPLEAAAQDIELQPGKIAFRCNLVTIADNIMRDYSAGHISTEEAAELISFLNNKINIPGIKFYPGVSYRHILIVDENILRQKIHTVKCVPPHDIIGQHTEPNFPSGTGAEFLCSIMKKAADILKGHEINTVKLDLQENPANAIWLWGAGTKPMLEPFEQKFGIKGSLISAVDLLKGIAKLAGLKVISVPGITGFFDTNYEGKADFAFNALFDYDFILVHVEAPDEAGHSGSITEKIKAIENFDEKVVGRLLKKVVDTFKEWRFMVLTDHATPISLKTHTADPVPFAILGQNIKPDNIQSFNELSMKKGKYKTQNGHNLLKLLFSD
ncbi:cofactor-independent phosphoglycerate mutase [bacterium]|nr:cofactor-independent phosphoglycerate mutase [bacterium]